MAEKDLKDKLTIDEEALLRGVAAPDTEAEAHAEAFVDPIAEAEAHDDDEDGEPGSAGVGGGSKMSMFRAIFGGNILKARGMINSIPYILFVTVLMLIYIANRYAAQQEVLRIDNLKDELMHVKYDAVSRSSELLVRTRQSRIMEHFRSSHDSTLQATTTPPYVIIRD